MTARETTLGALTAADLGKRVRADGAEGVLTDVWHNYLAKQTLYRLDGASAWEPWECTTPVTVYDEEEA